MNKPLLLVMGICVAMMPSSLNADTINHPKALVIMLDGLRGDAVENLGMTNLQHLIAGKWQPGYKCAWSFGASTVRDGTTESAPNHVAIATGMTVNGAYAGGFIGMPYRVDFGFLDSCIGL